MNPRVRHLIFVVTLAALSGAEGWVGYRLLTARQASELRARDQRIARLEAEVRDKTGELNHLIFARDAYERRLAQRMRSAPAADVPVRPLTPDEELAQAATLPMGAAPLSISDIDPAHLVSMANIMTGERVAELVSDGGRAAIHYKTLRPAEGDPLWQIVDAVREAGALQAVVIRAAADRAAEASVLRDRLVQFGVPPVSIQSESLSAPPAANARPGVTVRMTAPAPKTPSVPSRRKT